MIKPRALWMQTTILPERDILRLNYQVYILILGKYFTSFVQKTAKTRVEEAIITHGENIVDLNPRIPIPFQPQCFLIGLEKLQSTIMVTFPWIQKYVLNSENQESLQQGLAAHRYLGFQFQDSKQIECVPEIRHTYSIFSLSPSAH